MVGDEGTVLDIEGWRNDWRTGGLLGALGMVSIDEDRVGPVLSGDGRSGEGFLKLVLLGTWL